MREMYVSMTTISGIEEGVPSAKSTSDSGDKQGALSPLNLQVRCKVNVQYSRLGL